MGLLRLLLAIAVVIAHSTPIGGLTFTGAITAVHAFFMISGFYISLILNEKYIKRNNSYVLFITNRFLKLYPAYWAVLLLIIIFCFLQYYYSRVVIGFGGDFGQLSSFLSYLDLMSLSTRLYLIFINIFIVGLDSLQFLGLNLQSGNLFYTPSFHTISPQLHFFALIPAAWAISLEILFYVVSPFILRKEWKVVSLIIALSLMLRIFLMRNGFRYDPWTYRFFPTELAFFLFGNISYRIYKKILVLRLASKNLLAIFVSFLLLTILYNSTILAGLESAYLLLLIFIMPFIFNLSKNWKFDRYLGELSYLVFISHVFIISIIDFFKSPLLSSNGFTVSVVSIIFSMMLSKFVLARIEKFRQSRLIV